MFPDISIFLFSSPKPVFPMRRSGPLLENIPQNYGFSQKAARFYSFF